jgi:hypothetical protein
MNSSFISDCLPHDIVSLAPFHFSDRDIVAHQKRNLKKAQQ